jgi:CRISPR system Cascade subunit CasB
MTIKNPAKPPLADQRKYLKRLYARVADNNGAKAAFKRAMSGEPEHYRKIYEFVMPAIGHLAKWEQDYVWMPVACWAIFYPQPIADEEGKVSRDNFGHSCQRLAAGKESKGTERRFRALLDTSLEDLRSPLTALVRQMKVAGVTINYPQLLADLRQWEHSSQYVQDRWAKDFWRVPSTPEETSTETAPDRLELTEGPQDS